ncbi:uncharacterized protein EI97DRAFT_307002 [Westerdykella ornata]|uniref:Zn(2)-C6 fungal-type domain-containing protein n=1 Tax=Westerdykella ornata TaxID=318751 RepID=A0A6A6JM64_WESOR|nr:uncharacterized protein EI97DRAFT_307002 [Westerdykella ornata]KAF2277038.1 hypothetical protein EI97DRAFT_307002 [Westerdykella ornata]
MMHSRRVRRRVLACARCRKRKLSCDSKIPACGRCESAGVECVGFDSSTQREVPRSLADHLEDRIRQLQVGTDSTSSGDVPTASTLPSPAAPNGRDSLSERSTFADCLLNRVMEDITPSFLGITQARPLPSCVVVGTQLPPIGGTDLNATHPKSILNPQPSATGLDGFDGKQAIGLLKNYHDRILPQYPIYHSTEIIDAYNSVYGGNIKPGGGSPRDRYIVSLILAISLSTAARENQKGAHKHACALVQYALQWMPQVATNDIGGLQAMLLLTQYSFFNPAICDVWLLMGLISQAVIDLGLHQELPIEACISDYQRDMRRRLFWVAWETEVAVCSIYSQPIHLPIRDYEVAFPVEVDDISITEEGIDLHGPPSKSTSKRIWLLRQIEADIVSVLEQDAPLPQGFSALEEWMQKIDRSIQEWYHEVQQSARANSYSDLTPAWNELVLYADFMLPYVYMMLYKPSKRIPLPTTKNWLVAFESSVRIAEGCLRQHNTEQAKIKYVFHPVHYCRKAAFVFLQALSHCKSEVAGRYPVAQVETWMEVFPTFFLAIAERWPDTRRCEEEYQRRLAPVKREYFQFLHLYPGENNALSCGT